MKGPGKRQEGRRARRAIDLRSEIAGRNGTSASAHRTGSACPRARINGLRITSGRDGNGRVDIQGLVQRILLSIFAVALVAGIGGFYLLLRSAALTQAE